jgi:hypothetical protein
MDITLYIQKERLVRYKSKEKQMNPHVERHSLGKPTAWQIQAPTLILWPLLHLT